MIKEIVLFGTLIGSLWASAAIPENAVENDEVVLKNMSGKDDIMNLDFIFDTPCSHENLNKAALGKGKDKDRKKEKKPKKKKESSSDSSSDERRRSHRHDSRSTRVTNPKPVTSTPVQSNPVMRQQEVGATAGGGHRNARSREENTARTGDDGVITIDGPIRRKPLIFPS